MIDNKYVYQLKLLFCIHILIVEVVLLNEIG